MKQQQQPSKSATKFVATNVLIAAIVAVLLLVAVTVWLKHYTLHGREVTIPEVTGMSEEEAQIVLRGSSLYMVVVDSTYSAKAPLGTVVEQTPPAHSHAKPDRPVYVVMNAHTKQMIPLPELHDVSYRQAEATLRSIGLAVTNIEYEPSLYPDNVLDIRVDGNSVEAGTRLQEGSGVTLVIGRKQGNSSVVVPGLLGQTLAQARTTLLQVGLTIGVFQYDVEPTPETLEQYIIYEQSPVEGTVLQEGSTVNIHLTTDLERAITSDVQQNDERFF